VTAAGTGEHPGQRAQPLGAVVLTGGEAVRLGGVDKASIEIGGRTLLERTLAALADVPEVVVVGQEVPTSRPVTFAREDPVGGGPAAGLLAGLGRFARSPDRVVVLAVDMPLVTRHTVGRLVGAAQGEDGAVLVDAGGRRQYLCAAYSVAALERARHASGTDTGHGLAVRRLVGHLHLVTVPAVGAESRDLDTWEDLAEVRETVEGSPPTGPESQA
jgi:molybdopterin-guanine dinucleotide biosynthesis protein A